MIDTQLIPRGITHARVLAAFKKIPRHKFISEKFLPFAYADRALPISEGQTISQPYMVAAMTQALNLLGHETVLEVGTGSGYQAAILSLLCKKVYTIERFKSLSDQAQNRLQELGYNNIEYLTGDGTLGYSQAAPYDRIIVTAACPQIPAPLLDQLKTGAKLVIPIGDPMQQLLTIATKEPKGLKIEKSFACVFVPMIGKYGFKTST